MQTKQLRIAEKWLSKFYKLRIVGEPGAVSAARRITRRASRYTRGVRADSAKHAVPKEEQGGGGELAAANAAVSFEGPGGAGSSSGNFKRVQR